MAVHWGEVLVDTEASDPTARLLPVGDTLARPGRLLGYAEPGEILVSPEMERLVGGWCELRACKELLGIGTTRADRSVHHGRTEAPRVRRCSCMGSAP